MLCQGNGGHLGTPAGSKAPVPAGLHFLPFMSSVYTVLWHLWWVIIQYRAVSFTTLIRLFFHPFAKQRLWRVELESWKQSYIHTWILYLCSHNTFLLKSWLHKSYFSFLPLGTAAGVTWVVIISRSAIWCWAEPTITSKSIHEQEVKLCGRIDMFASIGLVIVWV